MRKITGVSSVFGGVLGLEHGFDLVLKLSPPMSGKTFTQLKTPRINRINAILRVGVNYYLSIFRGIPAFLRGIPALMKHSRATARFQFP